LEPESKTSLQSLFKDWTGSLLTGKYGLGAVS